MGRGRHRGNHEPARRLLAALESLRKDTHMLTPQLSLDACLASIAFLAATSAGAQSAWEKPKTPPPNHEVQAPAVEKNLKAFDVLDFDVFSGQKWERIAESHDKDIVVTWPDGHETRGIEKHIEDMKAMFVYAPDISIKEHPIRFGSGSFTTATGVMTGTFSKPMPIGGGKFIQPTGNRFAP